MQIRWLEAVFKKGTLSSQEITPYINLLMEPEGERHLEIVRSHLRSLSGDTLEKMLWAADIYDAPKLFSLMPNPTLTQAVIAVTKTPPPYEKSPQVVVDKVFQAVYDFSETLMDQAANKVLSDPSRPPHFREAFERFKEIKEDEKLLSALYPKAVVQ